MTTSGIEISKVSPRFLESNATSHTWPFSAIAELIDNAYDPDVAAKELWIDQVNIGNMPCLLFKDNGNGMDHEHLLKMLSFGFCEKDQYLLGETHLPIGQYGNGFKSGSMRLAKDALVFTVCKQSASIGFLSRTYLEAVKADNVLIPVLHYSVPELQKIDEENSGPNLEAILTHSPFKTEQDLEEELREISKAVGNSRVLRSGIHTGTKIFLFNLKTLHNRRHELDFQTDPKDIRNPEVFETDTTFEGPTTSDESSGPTKSSDISEHLVSLRKYCSILFIKPRMKIILRGQQVTRKIISRSLSRTEHIRYKPVWSKEALKITFGFTQEEESNRGNYGIFLYHRNRLIKPYEKVGYQKKPDGKGVGVVGVVEVNCLTPIHNKQEFIKDGKFNTLIMALGLKLNKYWDEQSELPRETEPDFNWVPCEDCGKWRKLPGNIPCPEQNTGWTCAMNPDSQYNRCDIPEEQETETPAKRQHSRKSNNDQPSAGKRKGEEGKEKEMKRARGETVEDRGRSEDPEKERTIIMESDVDEEEQMEEDLQKKATDQEDKEKDNAETQFPACQNSDLSVGAPLATTDMQQSGPRDDLNEHNAINSQPSEQETLHDAGQSSGPSDNFSFDGTDTETSNPVDRDDSITILATQVAQQTVRLAETRSLPSSRKSKVAIRNAFPICLKENSSDSKKGRTQTSSASNQKKSSKLATHTTMESQLAVHLPAQHQDTVPKAVFYDFKKKVHAMLCKLQPNENHGSVEEIEDTVDKILAEYGANDKN